MAYLTARRYGLTKTEPTETEREAGWRQVWVHSSGMRAMRHPTSGDWVVSDGFQIVSEGFCSSLRAAAGKIKRMTSSQEHPDG
jgi:hypothetical protein